MYSYDRRSLQASKGGYKKTVTIRDGDWELIVPVIEGQDSNEGVARVFGKNGPFEFEFVYGYERWIHVVRVQGGQVFNLTSPNPHRNIYRKIPSAVKRMVKNHVRANIAKLTKV